MKRRFLRMSLFAFILSLTTLCAQAQTHKEIDGHIAKNQLSEALKTIDSGLSKSPKSVEYLARKSRVIALQGDAEANEEAKVKLYEKAEKIASQAVANNPQAAGGYLRRAVAKGKLGLFKGILESRTLVLDLRRDAKKVLELSSTSDYEKALANYLLGRVHIKLGKKPRVMRIPLGLGWASKKKGADFLKNAVTLAPNSISFNRTYGEWLIEEGKKEEAKKVLGKIEGLEIFDPADSEHKTIAKKLISEL